MTSVEPGQRVQWYDSSRDAVLHGTVKVRSLFRGVPQQLDGTVLIRCDEEPCIEMGIRVERLMPEGARVLT